MLTKNVFPLEAGTRLAGRVFLFCAACAALAAAGEPYVEGTGAQAVVTDFHVSPGTKIVCDFAFTSASPVQQRVFGVDKDNATTLSCSLYINGGGGYSWAFCDGNGNWTPFSANNEMKASTDRWTATLDSPNNVASLCSDSTNIVQTIGTTRTRACSLPMTLMATVCDTDGTQFQNYGKVRIYSFSVSECGEPVMNLVPRIYKGEGVFYDTVSRRVFGSSTSTPLVAGDDCEELAEEDVAAPVADLVLSDAAGGVHVAAANARHANVVFTDTAGVYTVSGGPIAISGNVRNESAAAQTVSAPLAASGPLTPLLGGGLSLSDVAGGSLFAPVGTNVSATLNGNCVFRGGLSLKGNPTVVSPRVYATSGFSKDLSGKSDSSVQVTYTLRSAGTAAFGGGLEDHTGGQRGDVILLDGSFTFGGNVQPNGNDGYLVFRGGASQVGGLDWDSSRGYNSRLHVESGASLVCAGDALHRNSYGLHYYVDGEFTVNGTLTFAASNCRLVSSAGTGVVNVRKMKAAGMAEKISVSALNVGPGGFYGASTPIGAIELGAWTGDFTVGGSPVFTGTTLRAATPGGAPARITLEGAPVASGTLTKTGAGELALAAVSYPGLTGTLAVREGTLAFTASTELDAAVEISDGAGVRVAAGRTAALRSASFAGAATLAFGAAPAQTGALSLPAGSLSSATAVLVRIDGIAPTAGTTATLVSGAGISGADLAKFSLAMPEGAEGELSVQDGSLVLSVRTSSTAAARGLVWTGAESAAWDAAAANWTANGAAAVFTAYDDAFFDGTDAGDGRVDVAEGGVTAGAVTFDADKAYSVAGGKISGTAPFTIRGGAEVTLSAPLDGQTVVVTNGLLRVGAANAELLGDGGAYVEVRDGGTFDINATTNTADAILTTYNKKFRIAGKGFNGLGAINNLGKDGSTAARIHTIELAGDATISGATRWDMRVYSDGHNAGRPQVVGTNHALTVNGPGGGYVAMVDTDVDVGKLAVSGGTTLSVEGASAVAAKDGVDVVGSVLQFWATSRAFETPIFAKAGEDGAKPRIAAGSGTAKISAPVVVEDGAELTLTGSATATYAGGIQGGGVLNAAAGFHQFAGDVEQDELSITGARVVYGDMTEAGSGRKWPKKVAMASGSLCFAPSSNSVYGGYALTSSNSVYGGYALTSSGSAAVNFVPGYTGGASKSPVVTVEDTTLSGDNFRICLGLGATTSADTRHAGFATLGRGFTADSLAQIALGTFANFPANATLTIADGASVTMKSGGDVTLGYWSGETNNTHRLVVEGGTLDASAAVPLRVGYDARNAEFLVNGGTVKAPGVALRAHSQYNMKPMANLFDGMGYEVFGMGGGLFELAGDFTTERAYPMLPQIWLGGGTLVSAADWSTDNFQYGMFETWGDIAGTNAFTLATNGKTTTFRSALQGNSAVEIAGDGSFVSDCSGAQGGVEGRWTVANTGTATLKTAAAFASGLALTNGASATIDIGPRTNYVALAVLCNAKADYGVNPFTAGAFHSAASVIPSLFAKDAQKLFLELKSPTYTAYREEAEFYVDEAGTWTFAATYDDRGDVYVDGRRVAYNSAWNNVGVGSVDLAKGWHVLSMTCQDAAGGAGPAVSATEPKAFYDRGMAVGFHKGATTSTAAADYLPVNGANMKMRPTRSVRWTYRDGLTDLAQLNGWPDCTYEFTMVTNSMQAIHSTTWPLGFTAVHSFGGWLYVEPEESGTWAFDGVYDDRIHVAIDGRTVFANGTYNKAASSTAEVTAGWHSFRVTVCDKVGGISWSAVDGYGAALYVKRPCDATKVPFDERSVYMTAHPFGFIGGELFVGEGSTLANASANGPAEIAGTLSGTGTLTGPYRLTGTWNVSVEGGQTLRAATWGEGAYADTLANARIHVSMNAKPVKAKWDLGPALGLESRSEAELAAMLSADLNGEPYENGFRLDVSDGRLVLVNLKPGCTVLILR